MNAVRTGMAALLVACSTASDDVDDGASSASKPPVHVWATYDDVTIFRQPIATHFEAPFLALLVGAERALLIDTGTGHADVRGAVDAALAGKDVDLVVAHSHGHGDHVGGDAQFAGRPRAAVVGRSPAAVESAFAITGGAGSIDLGGRIVDVLSIPGHEPSHVAFYDRKTGLLFTGDTVYPGRLYVRDWAEYRASIARIISFVDDGHPVSHVMGAHVELSAGDVEYPAGATAHPDEHALALGEADLRDLHATIAALGDDPVRTKRPNYVLVPLR